MTVKVRGSARRAAVKLAAASVLSVLAFFPAPAWAQYQIDSGDSIELVIIGTPELRHRSTVNLDGEVSLPLVGTLKISGMTLPQVRKSIGDVLQTKALQQRTADGRDVAMPIAAQDISVGIVEYRPIYVSGDIARPGELPFRPGMIVRQAISVAGGYDMARFRLANPFLEGPELRSQYETLAAEYARDQGAVWRIQAELSGKTELPASAAPQGPGPKQALAQYAAVESDQFATRNTFYKEEKAYLERAVDQIGANVKVLQEQKKKEEEGAALDASEFERTQTQLEKGIGTVTRVSDARRASLISATRLLQTTVQIQQLERQREDTKRQAQQLDDKRRMELLKELQDSNTRLASSAAKLQATGEKMAYTGTLKSQFSRTPNLKPEVVIFRKTDGGRERIVAHEDEALLPGDAIEVTLPADQWFGTLGQ